MSLNQRTTVYLLLLVAAVCFVLIVLFNRAPG